ncbi:MAG: PEP-CTERM sorting domain-containing protein [Phycisphaerales bacterium]|nr:MAG: PEP-CTERM sorting domain-containing protein [Phycisphaerales bacterium]
MCMRLSVLVSLVLVSAASGATHGRGYRWMSEIGDFVDLRLTVMAEDGSPVEFNPPPIVERPAPGSSFLTGIVSYMDQTAVGLDPFEQPLTGGASGTNAPEIYLTTHLRILGITASGDPVYWLAPLKPTRRRDIAWVLDCGYELPVVELDYYPSSLSIVTVPGVKKPVVGGSASLQLCEIFLPGINPFEQVPPGDTQGTGSNLFIPEPATLLLLGLGGVVVLRRRGWQSGGGGDI